MAIYLPSTAEEEQLALDELTPREIVAELDKHVIGQKDAKRAVAIAAEICIYTNAQIVVEEL